jgi:hypothetical protein
MNSLVIVVKYRTFRQPLSNGAMLRNLSEANALKYKTEADLLPMLLLTAFGSLLSLIKSGPLCQANLPPQMIY